MTMPEIAEQLQRTRYEEIAFTIPGRHPPRRKMADLLNVKGVMDGQAFLAPGPRGQRLGEALGDYPWLPAGLTTLEGYLFPDTYRLPRARHRRPCPPDAGQLREPRHAR